MRLLLAACGRAVDARGAEALDRVTVQVLPCSSRIEAAHLLAAFRSGFDGVLLVGCPEGKCQFLDGNLAARRRAAETGRLLAEAGLPAERLRFAFAPEDEAARGAWLRETLKAFRESLAALAVGTGGKGKEPGR